jgi:hypothetical protein
MEAKATLKFVEIAKEADREVMMHDRSKGKKVMYHFLFA